MLGLLTQTTCCGPCTISNAASVSTHLILNYYRSYWPHLTHDGNEAETCKSLASITPRVCGGART